MIKDKLIRINMEENSCGVLSRNMPGGSDENHENSVRIVGIPAEI
jgi:hypothetical protein